MTISASDWRKFRALIDEADSHTEIACQKYLLHAAGLLLPNSPSQLAGITEDRSFFGRTDFVISANLLDDTNKSERHSYIFELKAPQLYLFETDTKNRCRPTKEFLQAENQLLHYFDEAAGNGRFRQRVGVLDQDNIHLGGIVIGTSGRLLRGNGNLAAARTALRVREKYLYQALQIRVLTWDRIADYMRPDTQLV